MDGLYSTQTCIHLGSVNQVPVLTGWGKGGNISSARWQVTLCDPIWHARFHSGKAGWKMLHFIYALTYEPLQYVEQTFYK